MSNLIEYKSENGYTGFLYGESSMAIGIVQPDGRFQEILHTGSRAGNSMEYLKEQVDTFPEFLKALDEATRSDKGNKAIIDIDKP